MITITLNQQPLILEPGTTAAQALEQQSPSEPYALAINDTFLARDEAKDRRLADGDRLDTFSPIQGG